MNRRSFFKLLAGAAAARVIEPVARTYFFAPPAGWELTNGIWASNGATNGVWASKTPEEILADVNAIMGTAFLTRELETIDGSTALSPITRRRYPVNPAVLVLPRTWRG